MVKLLKRLKFMETHKKVKPMFSQACDNLLSRVLELLGDEKSGAFVELIQDSSPTKEYFQTLKTNQFQPEMLMQTVDIANLSNKKEDTLPKVRTIKTYQESLKTRNKTLRDDYRDSSPVISKKRHSNSSASQLQASNYGASISTTRAKIDMPKSPNLNRISLDSRKQKKPSFTRKSNLIENERYEDQKYLVWSDEPVTPSNLTEIIEAGSSSKTVKNMGSHKPVVYHRNLTISTPIADFKVRQTRQGAYHASLTQSAAQKKS